MDDQKIPYDEIIDDLNAVTGKKFRHVNKSAVVKSLIKARWEQGFTLDDFKHVHRVKTAQWQGTDMEEYLCPTTLYRASKFEKYLNQRIDQKQVHDMSEFGIP